MMRAGDISSAMQLSTLANWNQTEEDWWRILQLSPEGCRCVDDDGRVVATTTLLAYGTRLGWIGMVLTRPEYRRKGLAKRLMEDAISGAERRGIRTLKLDATEQGRPLYESLGFVMEQAVERWGLDTETAGTANARGAATTDARASCLRSEPLPDALLSQDAEAFGASRNDLLENMLESGAAYVAGNGYVFSRPGRTAQYLGPCVVGSEAEAHTLIAACLAGHLSAGDQPPDTRTRHWYLDLFPANSKAVCCAQMFGFTRRRILWRMRRGEVMKTNDAMIYAIAGFELG